MRDNSKGCTFPCACIFIENIPLSRLLRSFCLLLRNQCEFSAVNTIPFLKFICSSSAFSGVSSSL